MQVEPQDVLAELAQLNPTLYELAKERVANRVLQKALQELSAKQEEATEVPSKEDSPEE